MHSSFFDFCFFFSLRAEMASRRNPSVGQQEENPLNFGMRDTIRFFVLSGVRQDKDLHFLYNVVFTKFLGLKKSDFFCVQEFASRGTYDVTLTSYAKCEEVFLKCQAEKNNEILKGMEIYPLYAYQEKLLTVHIYNPFITKDEIQAFLQPFCEKITFVGDCKNSFGLWNGKRRFKVIFSKDPDEEGGVRRPPPIIYIKRCRGYLFYAGMPPFCKKCKKNGHQEDDCHPCPRCVNRNHKEEDCPERQREREEEEEEQMEEPEEERSGGEKESEEEGGEEPVVSKEEEIRTGASTDGGGGDVGTPGLPILAEMSENIRKRTVETSMEIDGRNLKRGAEEEEREIEKKSRVDPHREPDSESNYDINSAISPSDGEGDLGISESPIIEDTGGGESPAVNTLRR